MTALLDKFKGRGAAKPLTGRIGPIGLHFAEEQVHAVQLRRLASGEFCLRAWASADYPTSREEALGDAACLGQLMTSVLGRRLFRGRKVVTALPPALTRITSLNYQVTGGASDAGRILQLMNERVEGSINDYVIDFLPVRGTASDREKVALVAASRRSDVLEFLENLHLARLEVLELEISPAAINRLVGQLPRKDDKNGNVLIINYGAERSYLTVISGRRLLLDKEIDFGANRLIEQIARGLDINTTMAADIVVREGMIQQAQKPFGATIELTPEDLNPVVEIVRPLFARLVEEIRRACLYAASESQGDAVENVYTFGTIARWPGADQLLGEVARIPVADTLPLTAIFDGNDDSGHVEYAGVGADLAVATGLALRGLTDDA